jgi:hypothetical protein
MNTNVITRQIGIAMLAFCATFVQTSMFAASHFGGAANAQAVHAADARLAAHSTLVNEDAASRRG